MEATSKLAKAVSYQILALSSKHSKFVSDSRTVKTIRTID